MVKIEDIQRIKESIVSYDWSKAIAYAKERYPKADAIKFRVCFKTNTFDLRKDYNNFQCFDNEEAMKEAVVGYFTNVMKDFAISDDYDLDIYISTDAFISKDHDDNDDVIDVYDVIDGKCFDDTDGNIWVSMNCVHWMLGFSEPIEDFWEMLGLGHNYNFTV